jgi:hypothetical protein
VSARTLGARLAHDRLAGRAVRLERVIAVLRSRAEDHLVGGDPVPPALSRSLGEFERELEAVREVLAETHRSGPVAA